MLIRVHCHVGSLESVETVTGQTFTVHCHVGSLENHLVNREPMSHRSLPCRQLRKNEDIKNLTLDRSLPCRQLRNVNS